MREPRGHSPRTAADHVRRRAGVRSVAGGAVVAILVIAIGMVLLFFRSQTWTATSSLLVLPVTGQFSQSEVASYYDTLSRGQIVATFAQIIQSQSNTVQRAGELGLTGEQAELVTVTVTAVPNTAIISIKVEAAAANQAVHIVDSVAKAGVESLQQLKTPYTAAVVAPAAPELAKRAGPSALTMGLVIAVVAVVAGIGAQQILWLLGLAMARRAADPGESQADDAAAERDPEEPPVRAPADTGHAGVARFE